MLPRILEPEVMDTPAEAADYDSMDHREVNRRFADDLLAAIAACGHSSQPLKILDLGTGTAQIPIELCQRTANISVVAVDAAENMLALAKSNIERAGLQPQISLETADAKQLDYADATFDAVISNSIIHHLPEPMLCLSEAVRVAKPAGLLFFRDLLRPKDAEDLMRLVNLYTAPAASSAAADHQRAMFADSLHAALTLAEIRSLVAQLNFATNTVHQTTDRHWTWIAQK